MPASQTKIKTTEMQRFINTFGGMVAEGEQPDETLIEIFDVITVNTLDHISDVIVLVR